MSEADDFARWEALPPFQWLPIAKYITGFHALFWFPNGEKGVGGFEAATCFLDPDDKALRYGWTHGGPNSGSDFDFCESPTLFMKIAKPA